MYPILNIILLSVCLLSITLIYLFIQKTLSRVENYVLTLGDDILDLIKQARHFRGDIFKIQRDIRELKEKQLTKKQERDD